jgi:hypothetical protein
MELEQLEQQTANQTDPPLSFFQLQHAKTFQKNTQYLSKHELENSRIETEEETNSYGNLKDFKKEDLSKITTGENHC